MKVRLVHIDGRFPNIALMKLAYYFKQQQAEIFFTHAVERLLWEGDEYDFVLGSVIFTKSLGKVEVLKSYFPSAIIGGPGMVLSGETLTVEEQVGRWESEQGSKREHKLTSPRRRFITNHNHSAHPLTPNGTFENYDYSLYPDVDYSLGFSSRGCRFVCPFCIVSKKEGKICSTMSISEIWRGEPHSKKILLMDNDFFGQDDWEAKCLEILHGNFRVSICQGINVRVLTLLQAEYIKKMRLLDNDFREQRIYTSWDNILDEANFFRGLEFLFAVGIKPYQVLVFYLTNFDKVGLSEDVWYRHHRLKELGVRQFPMIFEPDDPDATSQSCLELRWFQSWVIRRIYYKETFEDYVKRRKER